MSWYFNENLVTHETVPDWADGFVYKITHTPTGRYYIGKKTLFTNRNIKLGKRELATIKEERKRKGVSGRLPSKKFVRKESDWENYYSSNSWIKEQVKNGNSQYFHREIIQFCHNKKSMTYWETYWQMEYGVLLDDSAINDSILGKYYKKDIEHNK